MATGFTAAFDQIATVVASTSVLVDDGSGRATLERYPSRLDLSDSEDSGVHRRFHVLWDGEEAFEGSGGRFAGTLTDSYMLCTVQVGYHEGGGDIEASGGERHGVDRTAMDDCNRIRQHVEEPANYAQATTGIQLVRWLGTRRQPGRSGAARRVYEIRFRVWIEHTRLTT